MDKKNLITRTLSGAVYVAVLLGGIFGGKYAFIAVFGSLLAIGLFEFYRMAERKNPHGISKTVNISFGILIFLSVFLFLENISQYAFPAIVLLYSLSLFVSAILNKKGDVFTAVIYPVFGQLYITLPMCLLMLLPYRYGISEDGHLYLPALAVFVFIWVNDSFAYLAGSLFGKRKLIERISPKKSVEGFFGGIAFTVIAGLIFSRFATGHSVGFWIGFALIVALFGTIGDLFESLIKRTYGVKDSGNIIPGHGGILDRIDSLLVAIPAVYLYLITLAQF